MPSCEYARPLRRVEDIDPLWVESRNHRLAPEQSSDSRISSLLRQKNWRIPVYDEQGVSRQSHHEAKALGKYGQSHTYTKKSAMMVDEN